MFNFEYYTPTRIVFGKETQKEVGRLIKNTGAKKVLVHFGGGSVKTSGLLNDVFAALDALGIVYISLGGVQPNPRLTKVYEGIELCRNEDVDFILAVGGGSVIDSAKAIGYGAVYEGDVWDFYTALNVPNECLPIGVVLTLAAAGSEMSSSSVITNDANGMKRSFTSDLCRPKFAVMNPELTYSVSLYQTASGCVDIIAHVLERYFGQETDAQLKDGMSEALMRTVVYFSKVLQENPEDYNARAQIMWAATLAHNDVLGSRQAGHGDWACHQLEHELSGMFDVAHGAGIAAIWGSWARYVYKDNPARFAQLAVNVFGVPNNFADPDETAQMGINAMEDWYRSISMPTNLKELGLDLTDTQLEELAWKCSHEGKRTIGGFKKLDKQDMLIIYTLSR